MLTLVHLSDPHVDDSVPNANDVLLTRMDGLVKFCTKEFTNPIYVFTGDMINNGNEPEFNVMRKKLIEDMGIADRTLLAIGNHDVLKLGIDTIGSHFHADACARFYSLQLESIYNNKYIKESGSSIVMSQTKRSFENTKKKKQIITIEMKQEKTLFIILDSNMMDDYINNFARGELGTEVMQMMDDAIKSTPDDWVKVVMLHHHPVFNNYFQLMCDSDEFIKKIWDIPNILVMFGHKHSYMLQSSRHGIIAAAESTRKTDGMLKLNTFMIDNGKLTWKTLKIA
jgi:3',5'-cyclic AMP phosphodiesterase CpdA